MKNHLATSLLSALSLFSVAGLSAQDVMSNSGQNFSCVKSEIQSVPLKATLDLTNVQSDYRPVLISTGIYHEEEEGILATKPDQKDIKPLENYFEDHRENAMFKTQVETPSVFKSYNGYNDYQYTPPDNSIAVSNDGYIVSAMNCNYRIFKPDGTLLKYSSFYDLFKSQFPSLSGPLYDPRVLYDPMSDRFIVATLYDHNSDSSKIMLMFSKTSNPSDGWNLYTIKGDVLNKKEWTDYPNIAVNDKELFLTGNLFSNDMVYKEPVVLQINKQDGYDGQSLRYQSWSDIKDESGGYAFTLVPVAYGLPGNNYGPGIYLVSNLMYGGSFAHLYQITDAMDATNEKMTRLAIPTTFTYYPPATSLQKGSTDKLNAGDCRIKQAFILNNVIHYVFTLQNYTTNQSNIAYCRLNLSTKLIDYQTFGESNFNYSYPSLACIGSDVNDKSVMIAFERSGSTIFPEVNMTYCDNDMQFSNSVTIQQGASAVNITSDRTERWGDYSGIARRYNRESCVMAGCYGLSGRWNTRIAEVGLASQQTSIKDDDNGAAETLLYPNPAVNYFDLSFKLKNDANLNISLYDIQGRQVALLYTNYERAGKKVFSFNQSQLAQGSYVLRVLSDNEEIIGKTLIIK